MLQSFNIWDTRWPCVADDPDYEVDLILSFSRNLDEDEEAIALVDAVRGKFDANAEGGTDAEAWPRCFSHLDVIEAGLHVSNNIFFCCKKYCTACIIISKLQYHLK